MRSMMGCAMLLAAVSSAACHSMTPIPFSEVNMLKPDRAWATENDQSIILVSGPQVVGDTLVGYVNGRYEEMPTSQFKQIRVLRPATTKTVLLVGAVTVGFGGIVYALLGGGPPGGPDPSYCEEHGEDPACQM